MSILKALREAKGYTQKQLAELADVSLKSLQKYETGERDIARAEAATVCRLAKTLNTSVEELVGYELISYEELKEHMNKYELDISGATYFTLGYCGSLNKTIIDWIYKIIDEREQA